MQDVLFGLFKDIGTAETVHAQLLANGIAPEAVVLHHQDVPIAGARAEKPGQARPRDESGVFSGLFHSLFDSGGEMDEKNPSKISFREALHRGDFAVAVTAHSSDEMTMAERLFEENGAILVLHPGA
jgi:hypothetical protein